MVAVAVVGWRRCLRVGLRFIVPALGLGVLTLVCMMFLEELFIFQPSRYPDGEWQPPDLEFEDAWFEAADGVRLHGWYCPVPQGESVVLFLHGNAGNLTYRIDDIRLWQQELAVSVLILDYRGYGRSQGRPNEEGTYADARAAYRWLTDQRGVPAERIVLRGKSLGGAVAMQLALEVPHQGLILESTFTSAPDMGALMFPWLPVRWFMRNRYDSLAKIGRYRGPVLIMHGRRDTIVPFRMGRELFERANEPKWFHVIEGADHNDLSCLIDAGYFPAVRSFLQASAAQAARGIRPGSPPARR